MPAANLKILDAAAQYGAERQANLAMPKDEFCRRFGAEMLRLAGPTFDDGSSIANYADETAPTYWEQEDQRADGPEDCASSDISYWGE